MIEKIYSHTQALCPVCKTKVNARLLEKSCQVWMEKFCPSHGLSEVLISSDPRWFEASLAYVKPSQEPLERNHHCFDGCPESCGLCPEHQQHTCLPVIEITNQCQLNCPICLKAHENSFHMSKSQFSEILDNLFRTEGKIDVINLSGGEPTLHPDFGKFLQHSLERGVGQVSVSTNGLALLEDKSLREGFKQTQSIVALQFDGFSGEASRTLRGRDLTREKRELIEILEAEGIHYSLVSTVANGINLHEVKEIIDFFFQSKAISIMFQPLAFTGQAAAWESQPHRTTIPCVIRELEKSQTIKTGDFNPLPCSHYSCFALAYYLIGEESYCWSLKEFLGETDYLNMCANKTLPGLDTEGIDLFCHHLTRLWSAADSSDLNDRVLARVKDVLNTLNNSNLSTREKILLGAGNMKAVFIHQFMDIETLDFSRLVKCCNPYPKPGPHLIPMCAENVFNHE